MPSLLTSKYQTFLAQQVVDGLSAESSVVYITLGRAQEWTDSANASVNDSNPPVPGDTPHAVDYQYWYDFLAAKRVSAANVAFVVPRREWANNTVYAQYDDQNANLYNEAFYVMDTTSEPYRVYKCLWNNNGANSTVPPSTIGANVNPTGTIDGYVWQYMYTVDESYERFLTDDWMPVLHDPTVVTNAQMNAGRLATAVPLIITEQGAGYNAAISTTVTIIGDGAGAAVSANGVTITSGRVTSILLSSGGSGYTNVASINVFQSGASTPAAARAIIPPYPNHGADPAKELGARHLMFVTQFADDEGGNLTVVNNFRQIGLLANPQLANGAPANATFYRQTYDITLSANTGVLSADDIVVNQSKASGPTGIVVDVRSVDNTYVVRLTSVNPKGESVPFEENDVLRCDASGVEVTVASVSPPELKPYSGSFLYIHQRTPVTRSAGQTEDIKLIFPF